MQKVNVWSFIFSIICIVLFMAAAFSGPINYAIIGLDPFELLLYLTLSAFILALIGFGGILSWRGLARSIAATVLTAGQSVMLVLVVFFGKLLS
ncbi:hypothetical protein [Bacillus infantis]|uniref:Uncharacterized protein n=1 Tax=Bacillus infantis TaxID=324767 RepID=A0A5D4R5D2_9BACI|nr:hypothetical protein [Bacillus infantis]MCK6207417.1 hypothetical protein [Bacillus infantis]TYS45909.1 hypothetical protein FZD51_17845 [Bacillus infantis]